MRKSEIVDTNCSIVCYNEGKWEWVLYYIPESYLWGFICLRCRDTVMQDPDFKLCDGLGWVRYEDVIGSCPVCDVKECNFCEGESLSRIKI